MAGTSKGGGQRTNLSSTGGAKKRSATSTARTGSRVDPSHVAEKDRSEREKKTARAARGAAKKKKP
jgi:hypothetical protein